MRPTPDYAGKAGTINPTQNAKDKKLLKVDWDTYYANILLHEVFWLGIKEPSGLAGFVVGNRDEAGTEFSEGKPLDHLMSLQKSDIDVIQKSFPIQ